MDKDRQDAIRTYELLGVLCRTIVYTTVGAMVLIPPFRAKTPLRGAMYSSLGLMMVPYAARYKPIAEDIAQNLREGKKNFTLTRVWQFGVPQDAKKTICIEEIFTKKP